MDQPKLKKLANLYVAYDQETGKKLPVELSEGQLEIFGAIVNRTPARVHCMTPTQYGKSFVCALAVLIRALTKAEKWAIVAPSEAKAMIIMRYVIEHVFDNEIFESQLDVNSSRERLKRERSKKRINFKRGGEIFVLSADSKNKAQAGESLMGFGSANILLDESALIDDDIYAKIKRMLGGHKDNFLFEIGNPFNRNHFLRSFRNDNYHKILVNYEQAIKEGRITEKFIDEMRKEAFFDILYGIEFPPEDAVDIDGWSRLVTETDITIATRDQEPDKFGTKKLGVDIARSGGNFNVWVLRQGPYAQIIAKTTTDNLMEVVGTTTALAQENGVDFENIYLDATGMGVGVYDRFIEKMHFVQGINMSESARDPEHYINKRAEMYFLLQKWIRSGGMLQKNNDFLQLTDIKYKMGSNGKVKIISKDDLRRMGIPSPDAADALMLTFADDDEDFSPIKKREIQINRQQQPSYA